MLQYTVVLGPLLQEYRTRRMTRFAVWVLAYGAALRVADKTTGGVPGLLWFIFWVAAIVAGAYSLGRFWGFVKSRLLWRVRRRLVVTYLLIAVVPILLIILLVGLGVFIVNGQFAAFLVTQRLRNHFDELQQLNRVVVHEAHMGAPKTPGELFNRLQALYVTELGVHAASYPGLEITLRAGSEARAFRLDGTPLAQPVAVPAWFKGEEFAGTVVDGRGLSLRAVARTKLPALSDLIVVLTQPFTPELLDLVGEGIGPVGVVSTSEPAARPRSGPGAPAAQLAEREILQSKSVALPEPSGSLDFAVFGASTLEPTIWAGEKEQHLSEPVFVYVNSRVVALNRQLFVTLGRFTDIYVTAFVVVAGIFLVIELIALVAGLRLSRSITTTVDRLHDGTERVKVGDFAYRINLPPGDQLSALGEAFDTMTASVEHLLRESQEKTRLESEIEIAREVQRQLFPERAPTVRGVELYGVCKPARGVSGDYYDFLRLGKDRVGLALADVSGKGISAALLMATIQSALHAQFYDSKGSRGVSEAAPVSTAEVVGRLNRQLFENTPAEKYATVFYAVYDAATRRLAYTNAGHPPPVLFRSGATERLETGGTVVGLMSPMNYEQGEVWLDPGDLVLAFTDGFTEAENNYGEQFGEARVLEVARRSLDSRPEALVEEIYRSVADWTGSPELQDDMTLLVAKAVA